MIEAARVNALLNAASIEELWNHHTRFMAGYGFDRLIYGYTRYRTATSLGDPEDFLILSNHDSSYTDVFVGEGLYFNAPMVRWALANDGACSWSVLREMTESGTLTPEERRVVEFNQAHGVTAGYSISFKSFSPRTKGAIALTAQRGVPQSEIDALWNRCGEQILALNNVAHLRILSLPYNAPGRALTPRQREVLGRRRQDDSRYRHHHGPDPGDSGKAPAPCASCPRGRDHGTGGPQGRVPEPDFLS